MMQTSLPMICAVSVVEALTMILTILMAIVAMKAILKLANGTANKKVSTRTTLLLVMSGLTINATKVLITHTSTAATRISISIPGKCSKIRMEMTATLSPVPNNALVKQTTIAACVMVVLF